MPGGAVAARPGRAAALGISAADGQLLEQRHPVDAFRGDVVRVRGQRPAAMPNRRLSAAVTGQLIRQALTHREMRQLTLTRRSLLSACL